MSYCIILVVWCGSVPYVTGVEPVSLRHSGPDVDAAILEREAATHAPADHGGHYVGPVDTVRAFGAGTSEPLNLDSRQPTEPHPGGCAWLVSLLTTRSLLVLPEALSNSPGVPEESCVRRAIRNR